MISYVKGTAPGKWFRRWRERSTTELRGYESLAPLEDLRAGRAHMALARFSGDCIARYREDPECDWYIVELYTEQPGVAVPVDSELTLLDAISAADIDGEIINVNTPERPGDAVDVAAVGEALDVVGANVGVAVAPRPLLRSFNRRSCAHRDYTDGVSTTIALVWNVHSDCAEIQDFVGITRGRTARSGRVDDTAGRETRPKKRSARQKALDRQRRRHEKTGQKSSAARKQQRPPSKRRSRRQRG